MSKLIPVYSILAACFLVGCGNSLDTTVDFKGKVYYGYDASSTSSGSSGSSGQIGVLGPLANAKVIALGHSEVATTDSAGRYTLSVKASRKFNNVMGDQFILEASGTSSPSVFPQGGYVSEQIIVYGNPGDTVSVRDFLVYEHKKDNPTTTGTGSGAPAKKNE